MLILNRMNLVQEVGAVNDVRGKLILVGVSYVKICAESKNEHLICRSLYVHELFDIPLPH